MKHLICILTAFLLVTASYAQQDWTSVYNDGRQLFESKDYQKAAEKLRLAMSLAEQQYGTANGRYKASVDLLAKCYDAVGAHKQSIVLYKTLKDINTKENKIRTQEHADLLVGLGASYFQVYEKVKSSSTVADEEKQEMLDGAITNFDLGLKLHEIKSGKTSLNYLKALHWQAKASLYSKKERMKVPDYYEELYRSKTIFGGHTSDEYLEILAEYADVKLKIRDYPYAVKLYEEHIILSIQAGKDLKDYLESYHRAAKLNVSMKNKKASEISYSAYLAAILSSEGEDSKIYYSTLNSAIEDMQSINHLAYLDNLYERKLKLIETHRNKQSEEYAQTLYDRGQNALSARQIDAAIKYANASIASFKSAQTETHPNYAMANDLLGRIKETAGKPAEAEAIFISSQDLRRAHLGDQDPAYTIGLDSLGTFYLRRKDIDKAETYFMQALKIREVKPGKESAHYGCSLGHKATILRLRKQYEEEAKILEEQRKIFAVEYGVITPPYSMVVYHIATNQLNRKMYDEAMSGFQEASTLFKKTNLDESWVAKAKAGFMKAKEEKTN